MVAPNNPYPTAPRGVDPAIVSQIRQASQASTADFGLLMAQAKQESSFNPDAKAASGSASGLFQFVSSTWLDLVHKFGAKYGVGDLAQQITTDSTGKASVADPAVKKKILALRNDPALSADLAGEYANQNKGEVEGALGHAIGRAGFYLANFLGAGGATTFLKALQTNGATPAADLLPEAAANNRSVFYDGDTGRAKSVAEIYRTLGGRIEQEAQNFGGSPGASDLVASATVAGTNTGDGALPSDLARRFNLASLGVSQPVANMLDTLTLAALKLVGTAPHRRDNPRG